MEAVEEAHVHVSPSRVLTVQLHHGIGITASRRPAVLGLCSFANILLDFALTHTSFVPPHSGQMFLKVSCVISPCYAKPFPLCFLKERCCYCFQLFLIPGSGAQVILG